MHDPVSDHISIQHSTAQQPVVVQPVELLTSELTCAEHCDLDLRLWQHLGQALKQDVHAFLLLKAANEAKQGYLGINLHAHAWACICCCAFQPKNYPGCLAVCSIVKG